MVKNQGGAVGTVCLSNLRPANRRTGLRKDHQLLPELNQKGKENISACQIY